MLVNVKTFTARKTGSRLVSIQCEKCQTPFFYQLARIGIGKGSALYFIGEEGTKKRAAFAAEKNLARRLERECELVPCPKCNWVNEDLVRRYRKGLYRSAPIFIALILAVGLAVSPAIRAIVVDSTDRKSEWPNVAAFAIVALSLFFSVVILLIRAQLRARIDPNVTYPRRPQLPPGTPPALIGQTDALTGQKTFVVTQTISDEAPSQNEWAVFRPGQIRFPLVCCRCIEPACTTYRSPIPVNENSEIQVPLCARCSRHLRWRWWRTLFGVALGCALISALTVFSDRGMDQFGRWFVFGLLTFFGTLIGGIIIAGWVCRPYRFGVIDKDRGIMRFAAANPKYTALLIEQIRKSDGVIVR